MADKIDLRSTTIVIPLSIDSQDRTENIEIIYNYLNSTFDTTILISEHYQDTPKITTIPIAETVKMDGPIFHKTKVLNRLYRLAKTPCICRFDSDIIIRPEALVEAQKMIMEQEYEAVWPFDGRFVDYDRKWKSEFINKDFNKLLCGEELNKEYPDKGKLISLCSWGGAMMFSFQKYKISGLECELLKGTGSEDTEVWMRLNCLRKKWGRSVLSPIYHLSHFRGFNSWEKNEYAGTNDRITNDHGRGKEKLEKEIATSWTWAH